MDYRRGCALLRDPLAILEMDYAMKEPTINEMLAILAYLEQGTFTLTDRDMAAIKGIRTILAQHEERINEVLHLRATVQHNQLEAIRAFVERVNQHTARGRSTHIAIQEELAAMEKEAG